MTNVSKKIAVMADICLILTCVAVSALLLPGLSKQLASPSFSVGSKTAEKLQNFDPSGAPFVGKKLEVGVDWSKGRQTVVLILKKGCKYCEASFGFYQRLAARISTLPGFRVLVAADLDDRERQEYVITHELPPETQSVRLSPTAFGVQGTPSILLVDNRGLVVDFWYGKLKDDEERVLLDRLEAVSTKGLQDTDSDHN